MSVAFDLRSDITPLDYFLWGYVKSRVYANNPQSLDNLKVNITDTIQEIQADLCDKVIANWTSRVRALQRSRGGHLNEIIFHT